MPSLSPLCPIRLRTQSSLYISEYECEYEYKYDMNWNVEEVPVVPMNPFISFLIVLSMESIASSLRISVKLINLWPYWLKNDRRYISPI